MMETHKYEQNIEFYLNRIEISDENEGIQVSDSLCEPIASYSLGMKQKLFFLGSLVSKTSNLIYDELFSGLDPEAVIYIKKELIRLNELGATIVLSTHNLALSMEIVKTFYFLNRNRELIVHGDITSLEKLEETFIHECAK